MGSADGGVVVMIVAPHGGCNAKVQSDRVGECADAVAEGVNGAAVKANSVDEGAAVGTCAVYVDETTTQ